MLSQRKDRREGAIWDDLGALTTAAEPSSKLSKIIYNFGRVEDGLANIQVSYMSCSTQA